MGSTLVMDRPRDRQGRCALPGLGGDRADGVRRAGLLLSCVSGNVARRRRRGCPGRPRRDHGGRHRVTRVPLRRQAASWRRSWPGPIRHKGPPYCARACTAGLRARHRDRPKAGEQARSCSRRSSPWHCEPAADEVVGPRGRHARRGRPPAWPLPPGIIASWNGALFDLPFLADRARACGVGLGLRPCRPPRPVARGSSPATRLPGHLVRAPPPRRVPALPGRRGSGPAHRARSRRSPGSWASRRSRSCTSASTSWPRQVRWPRASPATHGYCVLTERRWPGISRAVDGADPASAAASAVTCRSSVPPQRVRECRPSGTDRR